MSKLLVQLVKKKTSNTRRGYNLNKELRKQMRYSQPQPT
ncbi:hypothetical protein BVRB_9g210380 [Beta vulgaris subsp. vulgaris]|nr:hypothetical protein BVRB_9g210380 [Beta vulgaris subsp. vulgaris]